MLLGYIYVETKINNGKQSTLSAGHFDRHGGAPVQYQGIALQCPSPLCRFSYGQSHIRYGLHVALTILNINSMM